MRYRRARIEGGCYALTVVTERRRPLFTDAALVDTLRSAITRVQARHPFELDAWVVLPDHVHMVWTLPMGDAKYSTRMRLIKEVFTRNYLRTREPLPISASRQAKSEQGIWQRRFYEHVIRDDKEYWDTLDYIHINPVHHGLVKATIEWPHSSFGNWMVRGVYRADWGTGEMPNLPNWAKEFD